VKALVTGAAGFAGRHLIDCLQSQGHQVTAADARQPAVPFGPDVESVLLDVTDEQACWEALHNAQPELLFHLAGVAHVGQAEADPSRCLAVNADGTRHMINACLDGHAATRFLLVSSAEVYGRVQDENLPVTEDHPLRPATVYAASKACAEMFLHHGVSRGLQGVVARAFNHIGPGQSDDFVAAAFAHQVARIEAGLQPPVLNVGNLEAIRDFSDVRHTVVGYLACLEVGQPGDVFNVTSGAAIKIRSIVDALSELSSATISVEVDQERLRPVDVPVFSGSGKLLADASGFAPQFDLSATLADVLNYWRAKVAER
jgi:GDP-4-dehydro-6-deoxy-D-mannose reductase